MCGYTGVFTVFIHFTMQMLKTIYRKKKTSDYNTAKTTWENTGT